MSSHARTHEITLRLNDDEIARLDEHRPRGQSRPEFLRRLLESPPMNENDTATHGESLAILTYKARDGSVAAAIALEKALREVRPEVSSDALAEIIGA